MLLCAGWVVAGGCGGPSDKTWTAESKLYPLALGNKWVFAHSGPEKVVQAIRTRSIVGTGLLNGKPAWKMEERGGQIEGPLDSLIHSDAKGVSVHIFDQYNSKDAERLDLSYPLSVGKTWRSEMQIYDNGHVRNMVWVFRVVGEEKVTVPAGTFRAVRVDGNTEQVDPDETTFLRTWFVPRLGPVMLQWGSTPDANERTFRLLRYTVK